MGLSLGMGSLLGGIGGGITSGLMGMIGQRNANKANKAIASDNRNWQHMMSSTSFQRQMDDLRRAGLNPMLAKNLGGASTPSGNIATMQNVLAGLGDEVGKGISSAMAFKQYQRQQQQTNAKITLDQQAAKTQESMQWLNRTAARRNELDNLIRVMNIPVQKQIKGRKLKEETWNNKLWLFDYVLKKFKTLTGGVSDAKTIYDTFKGNKPKKSPWRKFNEKTRNKGYQRDYGSNW